MPFIPYSYPPYPYPYLYPMPYVNPIAPFFFLPFYRRIGRPFRPNRF